MSFPQEFAATQQTISNALINTTRTTSAIGAEDPDFHRSSNPKVGTLLDIQTQRLLSLAEKLLKNASSTVNAVRLGNDIEEIDLNWRKIVDNIDSLLERADTCLDEFSGIRKQQDASSRDQSPAPKARSTKNFKTLRTQDIAKPQLLFDQKANNYEAAPFKPLLTSKPNAIVPLEQSLHISRNKYDREQYQHPYETEIEQYRYPSSVSTKADPIPYTPWDSTTATFVDDYDGVLAMLEELKEASEIAIDLEHHDAQSYIGLVSLMQISTRNKDWIVDTLRPWRRKLEVLNQVFTDPKILKVFHGAQSDIIWLQRDLGLYIVGLFDTHHASRVLGYTGGSLAFLLKKFIDFDAQKQYQLADWRVRPLPAELFDYARSDTHFLLYIYDNMRNELIDRSDFSNPEEDRIQAVLERSNDYVLQRYEHAVYDYETGQGRGGWFNMLQRNMSPFSKEQFAVYRTVHQWRDTVAREEDISPIQVMQGHVLFNIAKALPRDTPSLLTVTHPISPTIRLRASELVGLIIHTIANAGNEPEMGAKLIEISDKMGIDRREHSAIAVAPVLAALASQNVHSAAPAASLAVDSDIRASSSAFWGATLPSTAHTTPSAIQKVLNLDRLIQSLPHLSAATTSPFLESTATQTPTHTSRPSKADAIIESATVSNPPTPPSTLGKRKAAALAEISSPPTTDALATQADLTSLIPSNDLSDNDDPTAARAERKRQRREEKKAAQVARRAARAAAATDGTPSSTTAAAKPDGDADEDMPFDYASAPSVLNPTLAEGEAGARKREKKRKEYNPYARTMEAPGGVKRSGPLGTGRTGTFRN